MIMKQTSTYRCIAILGFAGFSWEQNQFWSVFFESLQPAAYSTMLYKQHSTVYCFQYYSFVCNVWIIPKLSSL